MNTKELNLLLINNFPELKENYHEEVDWQEGDETGSHVVYGDVFAPYIERVIEENKKEKLEKIFFFIEKILLLKEKYSSEVIMFSVLERLTSDKEYFQVCKNYIGKYTEKVINEM